MPLHAPKSPRQYLWTTAALLVLIFILVNAHLLSSGSSIIELAQILKAQTNSADMVAPQHPAHPILILQHDCECQGDRAAELARISIEQHRRYAAAHGYLYRVSTGSYVPSDGSYGGKDFLNKVWAALQVMLEELEKPEEERLKWIVQMDADTLIIDPAVAIHHTLPPDTLDPEPLILGQVDFNGFCNGVIFYKVSHRMATVFTRILSLEYNIVEPDSSLQPQPFYQQDPPMDQRATSLAIVNYRDIQSHFYRYPQTYFGSYHLLIPEFGITGAGFSPEDPNAIRGQLHIAGDRKDLWEWELILHLETDGYEEAAARAKALSVDGNGLELMPIVERVKVESARWWEEIEVGIEGIGFWMG